MRKIKPHIKELIDTRNFKNIIIPFYQPIINNKTLKIEKYEVLVRLYNENTNEYYSPYHFLTYIEDNHNLYLEMMKEVIKKSFVIAKELNINISINMYLTDFRCNNLIKFICNYTKSIKFNLKKLSIELLEKEALIKNQEINKIKLFLKFLQKKGIIISMDDFGAGFSNYNRLCELEPDIIKIDGKLIKGINKDAKKRILTQNIVALARLLDLKIVAEFVEDENIQKTISSLGVEYSQGYFFSKPLSMSELKKSVLNGK